MIRVRKSFFSPSPSCWHCDGRHFIWQLGVPPDSKSSFLYTGWAHKLNWQSTLTLPTTPVCFKAPQTAFLLALYRPVASAMDQALETMDYVPLYVLHLPPSPNDPAGLRGNGVARYALVAPPYCWFEAGTPVHLHSPNAGVWRGGPCRCPRPKNEDRQDFRGWIVGEDVGLDGDVEYEVVNEDTGAITQRATIIFRRSSGFPPLPSISERGTYPAPGRLSDVGGGVWPEGGPPDLTGQTRAWHRLQNRTQPEKPAAVAPYRKTRLRETALPASLTRYEAGPMTLRPADARTQLRERAQPAHPYRMWEVYGRTAAPSATRAESDGIKNYGQPIVVRPRERTDGCRVPFEMELKDGDGAWMAAQYSSEPPQRNPSVWYYTPPSLL